MDRTLQSLGVLNGTQLECDDYAQQLSFKIILFHNEELNGDEFELDNPADIKTETEEGDEVFQKLLNLN